MISLSRFIIVCFLIALSSCSSSDRPELHLYIWSSYIKPELIERFETETGCRVVVDTYDSNESMYAKFKAGAIGYDLVLPSNYMIELMIEQGMLQPLNLSLIPNIRYLDANYTKFASQATSHYGVPYMVSLAGIGFRRDKIEILDPSWDIFGESKWQGRMTMLNDIREVLGAALIQLGYSANTTNPQEIDEATTLVIEWKKNLAKFESEQYKNGIANAEYLVVQGYNGDLLQVMEENNQVDFAYPKKGVLFSIDYMVIPRNAPQTELAHAFINFMQRPEVAAENMEYTFFLCPNQGAYEKLSNGLKSNPVLFPPAEVLEKLEIIQNLGPDIRLYNQAWDNIKAN